MVNIPRGFDAEHDAWLDKHKVKTLRDLFKKGGLPRKWHKTLKTVAEDNGIEFISTPFSVDSAKFLVEEIGVDRLKIASGDITFIPLLKYAASTNLDIILSTGCATIHEVYDAVFHHMAKRIGSESHPKIVVLQCTSIYPCPVEQANVGILAQYKQMLPPGCGIGYSDHTMNCETAFAAVCLGATVVEKHFRELHDHDSIDADHSINPHGFQTMVDMVRLAPRLIGLGMKKHPLPGEMHDRVWARRFVGDWLRPTLRGREGLWE